MIRLKSAEELKKMRRAGSIVAQVHDILESMIEPGVSTFELDRVAEAETRKQGAEPAFLGYRGFPATLCISRNDVIVHGIPSKKEKLQKGDIVGIDMGARIEGYYGDSARTHCVGEVEPKANRLVRVTEACLWRSIAQCAPGNRLGDVGWAIEEMARHYGYGVVDEFVGHGIGKELHEKPEVRHLGPPGKGLRLKAGMVIAIEPMINLGTPRIRVLEDGWTAVTKDRSWSAHFEHTVAITNDGCEILTRSLIHPDRLTFGLNSELQEERAQGRAFV